MSASVLALLLVFLPTHVGPVGVTAGIPAPPIITPESGEYRKAIRVRIEGGPGSEQIRYTTDGSAPSCTNGKIYAERISIISDAAIRAVGCGMGGQSFETSTTYTFVSGSKAGNSGDDLTEIAGADDCTTNTDLCPPSVPTDGVANENILPPLFGTVLGNMPTILAQSLAEGQYSIDVALLQQALILLNSGPDAQTLGIEGSTGYFGRLTKSAVAEFQRSRHVEFVTGSADARTLNRIRSELGEIPLYFPQ